MCNVNIVELFTEKQLTLHGSVFIFAFRSIVSSPNWFHNK